MIDNTLNQMQVPFGFQWMVDEWGFPIDLAGILSAKNASHKLSEDEIGWITAMDNAWRAGNVDKQIDIRHILICRYLRK